jgi:hypothetical protein
MAEPPDEKSKLPVTGVLALLFAAVSSLIIYQVPLKTSRPIDKEAEKTASITVHRVQSRLWQDPFEAVTTHQAKEAASKLDRGHATDTHHEFHDLILAIKAISGQSDFMVLPFLSTVIPMPAVWRGDSEIATRWCRLWGRLVICRSPGSTFDSSSGSERRR